LLVIPGIEAVINVVPTAIPVASPAELMPAMLDAELLHVTKVVMTFVEPS
jgi:hypothetical protein